MSQKEYLDYVSDSLGMYGDGRPRDTKKWCAIMTMIEQLMRSGCPARLIPLAKPSVNVTLKRWHPVAKSECAIG